MRRRRKEGGCRKIRTDSRRKYETRESLLDPVLGGQISATAGGGGGDEGGLILPRGGGGLDGRGRFE